MTFLMTKISLGFSRVMITVLFTASISFAQLTSITTYYDSTSTVRKELYYIVGNDSAKIQGTYLLFSPESDTMIVGNFNNGLKNGVFKNFYPTGKVQRTTEYVAGLRQGETLIYFEDGNLLQKGIFKDDTLVSVLESYYPNGVLENSTSFVKGKPEGIVKKYYPDRKLKQEIYYADGKPNGPEKTYYQNGNVRSDVNYVNGLMNGHIRNYYESGQIETEAFNENGERYGSYKTYYSTGQLKYQGNYLRVSRVILWQWKTTAGIRIFQRLSHWEKYLVLR
jgi:antitoxin component YwqK of YwqJK toxin-antitoxin module